LGAYRTSAGLESAPTTPVQAHKGEQQPDKNCSTTHLAGNSFDLKAILDQMEKQLIEKTLSDAGGLQAEAARRMGLSRSALAYKLHRHGIRI
jgi:transcriptional regulator with GAF, ATPase, and Fis domain